MLLPTSANGMSIPVVPGPNDEVLGTPLTAGVQSTLRITWPEAATGIAGFDEYARRFVRLKLAEACELPAARSEGLGCNASATCSAPPAVRSVFGVYQAEWQVRMLAPGHLRACWCDRFYGASCARYADGGPVVVAGASLPSSIQFLSRDVIVKNLLLKKEKGGKKGKN